MKTINQVRSWFSEAARHTQGTRYLQICLGFVLLFRVGTEAPFAQYFWGPNGIGDGSMSYVLGPTLGSLLDLFFTTPLGVWCVLALTAAGAIGLMMGYRTRWATGLALLGLFMLEQRLSIIGDGGDNITRLTLMYALFLQPAGAKSKPGSLGTWVHNVAVVAIVTQLIMLYVTSGMMKTYGEKWHSGTAMYYISQVEWFSLPMMREWFKIPFVTTVATYVPMFFMVWFPIAIFSRFKLLWIFVGINLHFGIATMMGLITFSSAMIGLELFLVTDGEYAQIRVFAQKLRYRFDTLRGKRRPAPVPAYAHAAVSGDGMTVPAHRTVEVVPASQDA